MKYIKQYENHVKTKKIQELSTKEIDSLDVANESVEIVGEMYEVRITTEITQSFINSFIKKAETNLGIKVRKIYSDKDLAEMVVGKIIKMNLDIEKLNPSDFFGSGNSSQDEETNQEVQQQAPQEERTQETPQETPENQETPQETPENQEGFESTEENLPQ